MERKITSLKEHQDILYELLYVFDDFCKEHSIRYFLAYGTLLGAIRHNGIIPWDDDADVIIERDEYERFRRLIAEHPIEGYKAYDINNTNNYYYPFMKFGKLKTRIVEHDWNCLPKEGIGINIDIFPIDGCPNDRTEAEKYVVEEMNRILHNIRYWRRCQWKDFTGFKAKLKYPLFWLRKRRFLLKPLFKRLYREPMQYPLKNSTYFYNFWEFDGTKGLFLSKLIESTEYHKFGERLLPIPSGWDAMLKAYFGDYMTPPSDIDKESTHRCDLYIED